MKAKIIDSSIYRRIAPERVNAYLTRRGWEPGQSLRGTVDGQEYVSAQLWNSPVRIKDWRPQIVQPLLLWYSDYDTTLQNAVSRLVEVEGRSEVEIFADLLGQPVVIANTIAWDEEHGAFDRQDAAKRDPRWAALRILPSDYKDYGGLIERWADPKLAYPDCSCGCKFFDAMDSDWGVCLNPSSPRHGLLTWEHQAGFGCATDGE
jgi:hypothetical protein